MSEITVDAILAEMQRLQKANSGKSDGGMTTRELMKATGMGMDAVGDLLRKGIEDGLIVVGKDRRPNRVGVMYVVYTYRPAARAKEPKPCKK